MHSWLLAPSGTPTTCFSVIIPARNEAENIVGTLENLAAQNYPADAFEIIVVDDHSTDDTASLIESFAHRRQDPAVRLIRMADFHSDHTGAFKKQAIAEGIRQSRFEWIVTTDADCLRGPEWLKTIDFFIRENDPVMICGPVRLEDNKSLFQRMQALEFAGLVGTAGAALEGGFPMTCNGANLAYRRQAFYEAGGFSQVEHLNSGDDEMLMMKMHAKWPGRVRFLKNRYAMVTTPAQPTLRDFLQQRKRWVSKSRSHGVMHTLLLAFIYLFHALITVGLVGGIFSPPVLQAVLIAIVLKALADWPFLASVCKFLGKPKLALVYPLALLPQIFYVFFIGIYGNLGAYNWKGRRLR